MDLKELPYQLLEEITDGFSEERIVGRGGYGVVYKGMSKDGKETAVKMLHDFGPRVDDKQFQNELHNLMMLNHQNIVRCVGYCYETKHRPAEYNGKHIFADKKYKALCFEYMHNGSLHNHLSDEFHGLDWHTRYKIIKGTCEGLKYIHEEIDNPICHLDLKPANILLDMDMVPKLADFGLSNVFSQELTRITHNRQGTLGYMPPEYINKGVISKKFDIFSLGFVMINILIGPESYSKYADMSPEEIIDIVQENWRKMLQATWNGSSLEAYCQQVKRCTQIALNCLETDRQKRPNIKNIIDNLNEIETEIDKSVLLNVQPLRLRFRFEPNNSVISCSLHLTNNTDGSVAFRLLSQNPEYLLEPVCGIVPSRSNHTIVVTMPYHQLKPPAQSNEDFILESSNASEEIQHTKSDAGNNNCRFFMEAKEKGREVHQVKLPAVFEQLVEGKATTELSMKRSSGTVSRMTMPNNKKMTEELKEITDKHQSFSLTTGPSANELKDIDIRETTSDIGEAVIVGRTEEKRKIIASLLQGMTQKIIILPIYGIGGIGKTTFAKLVYHDTQFKDYSQVWVYVSQTFDLNKIGNSIVSQLSEKESRIKERQLIHSCLAKLLANKKILVVLDDLWEDNEFQLEDLKVMLKLGENSNIIVIVTTRNKIIAEKICTTEPYKIKHLTDDMCWDIVKQKSDFEARDDRGQLKVIGREIAQKCAGVALAAQSLGYMLKSMSSDAWQSVNDSNVWGHTLEDTSSQNRVLASLKLSYCRMPQCLKLCFAYCAIFPKGHKIVKNDLIHQWISLGFMRPSEIFSTWQLCERYIRHLLGLSFLEHLKPPPTAGVYYEELTLFTMHDLVHDLARSIVADELLHASKQGNSEGNSYIYALLTDYSKPLELSMTSFARLRALHFLDCHNDKPLDVAFLSAKSLRILDLSGCSIHNLPDSIGQLEQLRYLNAPGIQDQMIPNCITKLSKLNYLSMRDSSAILALPESIGEMEGLVHLDLSGCPGIGKLPESFGNLKNLEHLDLSNCSNVTGVSEFLCRLMKLQYLNLSYCTNIGKLPRALGSLRYLQYLNLSYCSYLEVPEAEVLGALNKLKYLNLSSESSCLRRLPEALGSMTELRYLNLSGLSSIKQLPKSFGKLHSLVHLDLSGCLCVEGVPKVLSGFTKLQYLNLSNCSSSGKNLCRLRGMQEVMGNLTELRYLNLSRCLDTMFSNRPLQGMDSFLECISNLSNLEHLKLSMNKNLCSVPETLGNLRKLHTLDLSFCPNLDTSPASIVEIDSLKFINLANCWRLDNSMVPQFNNSSVLFPHSVFHGGDFESTSNLVQLEDEDPTTLEITRGLENVKSTEEVQRTKATREQRIRNFKFGWTRDAMRFMEEIEVLRELVSAGSVKIMMLQGYSNSVSIPSWLGGIVIYLPHHVIIIKMDQPPLAQSPNLKGRSIGPLDSIMNIVGHSYRRSVAFSQLETILGDSMERLELRLEPCPPSADVMSSWRQREHVGTSSSAPITKLFVEFCEVPLYQWRLLHHLPPATAVASIIATYGLTWILLTILKMNYLMCH